MEAIKDRLKRFLCGSPNEIFLTILNSVSNFTLGELQAATDAGLYNLVLLGAHAVMQTITEQIYGQSGLAGTTFYLKNFVDGDTADTRFSEIAEELHTFRNVQAHRWSARSSHTIGFDSSQEKGWWQDGEGLLHINPVIFMKCFSAGFRAHHHPKAMWRGFDELTALRQKYRYLRQWLEVERESSVSKAIDELLKLGDLDAAKKQEETVRALIMRHLALDTSGAT